MLSASYNLHALAVVLIICSICPNTVNGQSSGKVVRFESAIEFDGKPDDKAWADAEALPLITQMPTYGLEPSQKSIIKLAFDDQYVYMGASLFVTSHDMIRAIGKKRDLNNMACDWVGISLDTYNDKENSLLFFTNPNGVRWDATIRNDGTPGDLEPLNLNWNTFWEVKTVIEDLVWHAEFKIPISSLRFNETVNTLTMGISVFRFLPSTNEGYIFPDIPYDWGDYSNLKPSTYAELEFEDMKPRKPLYISPYILSGYEQTNELNADETVYNYNSGMVFEPGIDIKYGINTNTTLDLTVNTDFAQVEADDQQFNLTRFSLVYPEKRPFFLERAGIFDFGLGGPNRLFYSREIGLYDGSPVRIYGGARLVSKVKDWDLGFLNLQTAEFSDLPSENFGVLRVKKKAFNKYSYLGGMITSRLGMDGTYNLAYGIDGVIRLFEEEYLTLRWAQSFEDSVKNDPFSLDPARFLIKWTRRKQNGLSYDLQYNRSGTDFNPGIGLEVFEDYYATQAEVKYTWIPGEDSRLQNHAASATAFSAHNVVNNKLLMLLINPGWSFSSKTGWGGSVLPGYNYEFLEEDFEITDSVYVPVGEYQYVNANLSLNTPFRKSLRTILTLQAGQFYDGMNISPMAEPQWNIGSSLELGALYRYDYIYFEERTQVLNNHIFGIRGLYMISTQLSLSAFVQYNTAVNKFIPNIRFRYNPKEGTDLYIVFNESRNTLPGTENPPLPDLDYRSIMVKFTYTFDL